MDPVRTLDDVRMAVLETIQKVTKTGDFSLINTLIEKLEEITLCEKYLQHKGVRCPICNSPDLSPGKLHSNAEPSCDISCDICGSTFTEVYILDRIEDIDITPEGRKYLSQLKGTSDAKKS